jgi:pantetheine-phosphate adenylyltransferase
MKKIAVFPGSFDPFTKGHESIVKRALPLFDEIIIAIGFNHEKQGFFPIRKRKQWIEQVFKNEPKIVVDQYNGLTVDYCKEKGANFLLRGLRTAVDFEYERIVAQNNKAMAPDLETVFILTMPEHTAIHSTTIRDILRHGGDASQFVPEGINLED